MYSRQRSDALADFQLPELRRSPLDEMCLQVWVVVGRCLPARRPLVEPDPAPAPPSCLLFLLRCGLCAATTA